MSRTELALFGGEAVLPDGPSPRPPFGRDILPRLETLLLERPLSTLFGDFDVATLEAHMSRLLACRGAVAVNAGTSSLHTALVALGVGPGDEVAVTSFSFVASASVIVQLGATPVFVDIDPETLGMAPEDLERKLTPRTRAVIVAHLFGIPAALDELERICSSARVPLVEDACQALGARVGERAVGTVGDVGCFSFNVTKVVQTGEGGMLVSDREDLLELAREIRVNGISPFGIRLLGFNYTMSNLQALVGCYQLERFEEIHARRGDYASLIAQALSAHAEVFEERRADVVRAHYSVPFRPRNISRPGRDAILVALTKEGVPMSGVYEPIYRHTAVFGDNASGAPCPAAEQISATLLTVSPNHNYQLDDVQRICEAIDKVLARTQDLEAFARSESSFRGAAPLSA